MKISGRYIILKRAAGYGVLLISVAVFVCMLIFAMMQTEYFKGVSVNLLNRYILSGHAVRLEAGNIKGVLPFDFIISELEIYDMEGRWMRLGGCSVRILPSRLLAGRLYIKKINVDKVVLERLPRRANAGRKERLEGFTIPYFPSWLTVEDIQALHIDLNKTILGEPSQYSLSGGIKGTGLKGAHP